MIKKTFLKLLVICLLFGYTPETKPIDPMLGLAIATAILPGIGIGLAASGLGYGIYSWVRPYNEKELVESNTSISQKIEKHNKLFNLIKIEQLDEFIVVLKDKKIKNREGLRIFLKDLKGYSKKLTKNKTKLVQILEDKEKKQETLGIYDIKQSIDNSDAKLLKLNALQDFVKKNKALILEKLKY